MTTIVALVFTFFEVMALFFFVRTVGAAAAAGLALLLVTNAIFVYLLRTLTPAGRELMDHIEGFKQFLTMVEGDRLQRADAPAKTPELFEKCLPYALALGVEQAWAEQFESVLAKAATAPGGSDGYSPIWFARRQLDRLQRRGLCFRFVRRILVCRVVGIVNAGIEFGLRWGRFFRRWWRRRRRRGLVDTGTNDFSSRNRSGIHAGARHHPGPIQKPKSCLIALSSSYRFVKSRLHNP